MEGQQIIEIERRRKMFHWFVNGLGDNGHIMPDGKLIYLSKHGLDWRNYDSLTPDWVTEHYNINL